MVDSRKAYHLHGAMLLPHCVHHGVDVLLVDACSRAGQILQPDVIVLHVLLGLEGDREVGEAILLLPQLEENSLVPDRGESNGLGRGGRSQARLQKKLLEQQPLLLVPSLWVIRLGDKGLGEGVKLGRGEQVLIARRPPIHVAVDHVVARAGGVSGIR